MPEQTYVDQLVRELRAQRPDVMRAAEDELKRLRIAMRKVADFLHNQAIALDVRQNLARDLQLPVPKR